MVNKWSQRKLDGTFGEATQVSSLAGRTLQNKSSSKQTTCREVSVYMEKYDPYESWLTKTV